MADPIVGDKGGTLVSVLQGPFRDTYFRSLDESSCQQECAISDLWCMEAFMVEDASFRHEVKLERLCLRNRTGAGRAKARATIYFLNIHMKGLGGL